MTDYSLYLLKKYQQKGILIDTNILLLLFVGETNRARISQFKRTNKFSEKDYDLLIKLLKRYSKIVTTPNILTEVNSLINQISEPERSQCLRLMSNKVSRFHEIYI